MQQPKAVPPRAWPAWAFAALACASQAWAQEAAGQAAQLEDSDAAELAVVEPEAAGPHVIDAQAIEPQAIESQAQAVDAAPARPHRPERGVVFRIVPPPAPLPLPADAAQPAQGETTPMPSPPTSYLLGTIHFGTPDEQGIDYDALAALAREVETFVNEADAETAWQPAYDGYRWLPAETPLSSLVGEDDIAMARALLPAVRAQDLERMKPWAVLALLEARGERGGEEAMDARLQRIAREAGKPLVHLETLEQQLQALDCVPANEHAQVLDERLRKSWLLRIESAEAMAFYRSRNLDAWLANIDEMEGLSDAARVIEQRARHCLLEERNARWIGPLQTLFQDRAALVAVGAIHLVGPDGLIARLRRDGYRVDALPL